MGPRPERFLVPLPPSRPGQQGNCMQGLHVPCSWYHHCSMYLKDAGVVLYTQAMAGGACCWILRRRGRRRRRQIVIIGSWFLPLLAVCSLSIDCLGSASVASALPRPLVSTTLRHRRALLQDDVLLPLDARACGAVPPTTNDGRPCAGSQASNTTTHVLVSLSDTLGVEFGGEPCER